MENASNAGCHPGRLHGAREDRHDAGGDVNKEPPPARPVGAELRWPSSGEAQPALVLTLHLMALWFTLDRGRIEHLFAPDPFALRPGIGASSLDTSRALSAAWKVPGR